MAMSPGAIPTARSSSKAIRRCRRLQLPWISSFNIYYSMGFDGISFPLVILDFGS